ncbi:YceI family protein [Sphingomicrobium astaxanthinifaciens]|uniref:YceI family protein n=1 Tax=Sphingomicrobium astaxanthinifaciens TaxID=1227949 RepID=UPI001FCAF480|nr:YceI family protein [Sphingomicrobium astaxanthinifaciens]MCJ7421062.1 YceI family protein [Sphingomicrobium astaxanthinifaciens]
MKIATTLLGPLALVAAAGHLAAQPAGAPATPAEVAAAQSGYYVTDPAHTLVRWSVSHFGFNPYWGSFGDVEGHLHLDTQELANSRLDVTIPIDSLAVVSEGLREHLLRPGSDGGDPDFFGPEAAPARFVSSKIRRTGPTSALIHGELTLNGVTRPVAIAATFTGAGANPMSKAETLGFTGRARIVRSQFGIDFAVQAVSDEVDLEISAAFERQ